FQVVARRRVERFIRPSLRDAWRESFPDSRARRPCHYKQKRQAFRPALKCFSGKLLSLGFLRRLLSLGSFFRFGRARLLIRRFSLSLSSSFHVAAFAALLGSFTLRLGFRGRRFGRSWERCRAFHANLQRRIHIMMQAQFHVMLAEGANRVIEVN